MVRIGSVQALLVRVSIGSAILAATFVALPAAQAAASTCTDTVYWDGGLTAHVDADTCHTAIRMVGYCAVSGIEGNTVYYAGDNFGIGANTYLPWATACENGTPNVYPILYVLLEERGVWQNEANNFWGAPGKFSSTWTAR